MEAPLSPERIRNWRSLPGPSDDRLTGEGGLLSLRELAPASERWRATGNLLLLTKRKACRSAPGSRQSSASKRLQAALLVLLNIEEPVELGDFENFVDLRIDVAKNQPPAGRLQL